ncbi:MAG: site-specific integrase [Alphaproteobacteria bacterium]|nr:MAG: site-specific integrase [Alphaproteobacteria bacterium]
MRVAIARFAECGGPSQNRTASSPAFALLPEIARNREFCCGKRPLLFVDVRRLSRDNEGTFEGTTVGALTAKFIERAGRGRHADGSGLYLLVKPSGARTWVLRVQVDGRRRDIGLGSVKRGSSAGGSAIGDDLPLEQRSQLTLAEARELSARLRNVAKAGRDPAAERRRDRSPPPSFKEAAIATHSALAPSWSQKTADAFLVSLQEHAYPFLGSKRVDEIEADDVAAALKAIWTSKPGMARKVRQRIGKVLDFSKAKRWRASEAPRQSVTTLVGKAGAGRNFPAMPYESVPEFYDALSTASETKGRLALMLIIATAARSGEVRTARWKHINWERCEWHRPADLMKAGKPHVVTLNHQALEVLRRAAAHSNSNDSEALIFANREGGRLSDMTISKVMRDAKTPYVPHGFRSSFRDWAAEKMPHVPDPVAEAALAHVVSDAVVRAYKRTDFLEMRRQLLGEWGQYISDESLIVVPHVTVRAEM